MKYEFMEDRIAAVLIVSSYDRLLPSGHSQFLSLHPLSGLPCLILFSIKSNSQEKSKPLAQSKRNGPGMIQGRVMSYLILRSLQADLSAGSHKRNTHRRSRPCFQ